MIMMIEYNDELKDTIDPKCVKIRIDAWFCCKCHGYNPAIILDIEVPPQYIPAKSDRPCYNCDNITRVGTNGREIV